MMCKESICRDCFHSYVCEQFNENKDDNNEKCHFLNDHYVPAADVVPKSEVERLQESNSSFQRTIVKLTAEIERLNAEMTRRQLPSYCQAVGEEEAIKIGKEYGRAEVAREIFAEIEELKWIPFESEHYVVGYDDIAELKKKYTGEQK